MEIKIYATLEVEGKEDSEVCASLNWDFGFLPKVGEEIYASCFMEKEDEDYEAFSDMSWEVSRIFWDREDGRIIPCIQLENELQRG